MGLSGSTRIGGPGHNGDPGRGDRGLLNERRDVGGGGENLKPRRPNLVFLPLSRPLRNDPTAHPREFHRCVHVTIVALVVHAQLGVATRISTNPPLSVSAGRTCDALDGLAFQGFTHGPSFLPDRLYERPGPSGNSRKISNREPSSRGRFLADRSVWSSQPAFQGVKPP